MNPPPGIAAEDYIEQRTSGLAMEGNFPPTLQPSDPKGPGFDPKSVGF